MSNFLIQRIDEYVADRFWREDTNSSIFTKPSIIKVISHNVHWWGCFSNGNLIAAWPICIDRSENIYTPEFSYYVGPIFSNKIVNQPAHRKSSSIVKIYQSFTSRFEKLYEKIQFCLDTNSIDVRFFLWENHSLISSPKYEISTRYTACIDDLQKSTEFEIQSRFRSVRRQNIKYALKNNFRISPSTSTRYTEDIINLYYHTLERQGIVCNSSAIEQIKNLIDKIPPENLICIHIHPEYSEDLIFFGLVLHDKKTANLVLNCTDREHRNTGVSSLGIYSSIIESKKSGCNLFDFNGANSPSRADDKHSYGAEPRLFFHIDRKK